MKTAEQEKLIIEPGIRPFIKAGLLSRTTASASIFKAANKSTNHII